MTDQMPTREEVRESYVMTGDGLDFKSAAAERGERFDEWLAAHDAEVRSSVQPPSSALIEVLRDLVERNKDYDPANPNERRSWDHGIDCGSIEWGYDGIEGDSGDPCDCWRSVVAELLPQPTPSTGPCPDCGEHALNQKGNCVSCDYRVRIAGEHQEPTA